MALGQLALGGKLGRIVAQIFEPCFHFAFQGELHRAAFTVEALASGYFDPAFGNTKFLNRRAAFAAKIYAYTAFECIGVVMIAEWMNRKPVGRCISGAIICCICHAAAFAAKCPATQSCR